MKEHIKPCICNTCIKARDKALQSQTQDIKKKIKRMEKDYENRETKDGFCQECHYLQCKCLGYNQALSDILEELSKGDNSKK